MIMLSRPEFAALHVRGIATRIDAATTGDWHGPAWPVNEVMLSSLLRTGKTAAQIADAFGIGVDQVTALRCEYGL